MTSQCGVFTNTFLSKFDEFVKNTTVKDSLNWNTFSRCVKIDNGKQKPVFNIISAKVTKKY